MGRSKLIKRALGLAQKQHGVRVDRSGSKEKLNFSQQQQGAKASKLKKLIDQYPSVGVREIGAAVQLLSCFPEGSQPAYRTANSLCTILGSSTHITPGPTLTKILKDSYLQSSCMKSLSGDWTRASFRGVWQWVQNGTKKKVQEWQEVGVAMDDILGLVRRARMGGNKLKRLVFEGDY